MELKIQERNQNFQKSLNEEFIQSSREIHAVELRKKKRSDHIIKKRAFTTKEKEFPQGTISFPAEIIPESLLNLYPNLANTSSSAYSRFCLLSELVKSTSDFDQLLLLMQTFKSLAGRHKLLPYSEVFDDVFLQRFLEILASEEIRLKSSALWIIINIFHIGGELLERFVRKNILDLFYDILKRSACPDVIENCIWALGNLAGESPKFRDLVISKGFIEELIENCRNSDYGIKMNAFWVLSILSSGKPNIGLQYAKKIISVVSEGLTSESKDIAESCILITEELTEKHSEIINIVINTDIIHNLLDILQKKDQKNLLSALKIFGNIAGGTDKQTRSLIDLNFLGILYKFLNDSAFSLKKEALFIASNILASNHEIIESFLQTPCIQLVIEGLVSTNFSIKKEAVTGISNFMFLSQKYLFLALLKFDDFLSGMISGLDETDEDFLGLVLGILINLMKNLKEMINEEKWELFIKNFIEEDGVNKLEILTLNRNSKVSNQAKNLLNEYFEDEVKEDIDLIHTHQFEFN